MESFENRDYIGIIVSGILHILILFIFIQLSFIRFKNIPHSQTIEVVFEPLEIPLEEKPLAEETVTDSKPSIPTAKPAVPKTTSTPSVKPSNNGQSSPKNNNSTVGATTQQNADVVISNKKKYGDLFGNKNGNDNGTSNGDDPNGEGALSGISKGNGIVGGGLTGRKAIEIPAVSETSQKTGRVVVKVCVAADGRVISSKFTQQGSTTSDAQLVRLAEKGASKYRFSSAEVETQCGTITFDFKLQ